MITLEIIARRALGRTLSSAAGTVQAHGKDALIGDPGRSYLPKAQLEKLAGCNVPVTRDLEDAEIKKTAAWQLRA